MANPRFPPSGSPQWFAFAEQWILKERVDNERQWRLLRQVTGLITGLDPIQDIVSLQLPTTTTSTTTEPPTSTTTEAPTSTTTEGPTSTTTAEPTSTTTAEPTSTTTVEPTSTTTAEPTTTTSTTTAVNCTGDCNYSAVIDPGTPTGFNWNLDSDDCAGAGCGCLSGNDYGLSFGYPVFITDTATNPCDII